MIVRAGLAATITVMFSTGAPDGVVSWLIRDPAGSPIDSGTITPAADAVSVHLPLSSTVNTLDVGQLLSSRDIEWSYTTGGAIINGEERYTIEARPPLGVSASGVRSKLGVSAAELPDSEIRLIPAYLGFRDSVGTELFDAAVGAPHSDVTLRDAIEATAALALLPTMPVRVAKSESSGTDTFERQPIDWAVVALSLDEMVTNGTMVVLPNFDPAAGFGSLLILATPAVDAITGAAAN